MRVPQFERFARLSQGTALAVVGAIVGAVVYHSVFFMNFEALKNTLIAQESKLIQYEQDIAKLSQYKKQHTVIKSISPFLEDDALAKNGTKIDELTKRTLKDKIREELSVLLGRSVYDIDSDAKMARLLLSRKEYKVLSQTYTVEIKTMLLADNRLQIWFTANVKEPPPA